MLCPKCGYNSFDHYLKCPKCRKDWAVPRKKLSLTFPQPGNVDFFNILTTYVPGAVAAAAAADDVDIDEDLSPEAILNAAEEVKPENTYFPQTVAPEPVAAPAPQEPLFAAPAQPVKVAPVAQVAPAVAASANTIIPDVQADPFSASADLEEIIGEEVQLEAADDLYEEPPVAVETVSQIPTVEGLAAQTHQPDATRQADTMDSFDLDDIMEVEVSPESTAVKPQAAPAPQPQASESIEQIKNILNETGDLPLMGLNPSGPISPESETFMVPPDDLDIDGTHTPQQVSPIATQPAQATPEGTSSLDDIASFLEGGELNLDDLDDKL